MTEGRCPWASDELMIAYHDTEWGVPIHEDRHHFELLSLEGAQAGLSWRTVLQKRDGYRELFANFEPERVARFDADAIERLRNDARIVRNRAKIESVVSNAQALLDLVDAEGSFDSFIWAFVGGAPIVHEFATLAELPASDELSTTISKVLKRRGFRFVGPTIIYSYLQSAGLVLDHLTGCPRWRDLRG